MDDGGRCLLDVINDPKLLQSFMETSSSSEQPPPPSSSSSSNVPINTNNNDPLIVSPFLGEDNNVGGSDVAALPEHQQQPILPPSTIDTSTTVPTSITTSSTILSAEPALTTSINQGQQPQLLISSASSSITINPSDTTNVAPTATITPTSAPKSRSRNSRAKKSNNVTGEAPGTTPVVATKSKPSNSRSKKQKTNTQISAVDPHPNPHLATNTLALNPSTGGLIQFAISGAAGGGVGQTIQLNAPNANTPRTFVAAPNQFQIGPRPTTTPAAGTQQFLLGPDGTLHALTQPLATAAAPTPSGQFLIAPRPQTPGQTGQPQQQVLQIMQTSQGPQLIATPAGSTLITNTSVAAATPPTSTSTKSSKGSSSKQVFPKPLQTTIPTSSGPTQIILPAAAASTSGNQPQIIAGPNGTFFITNPNAAATSNNATITPSSGASTTPQFLTIPQANVAGGQQLQLIRPQGGGAPILVQTSGGQTLIRPAHNPVTSIAANASSQPTSNIILRPQIIGQSQPSQPVPPSPQSAPVATPQFLQIQTQNGPLLLQINQPSQSTTANAPVVAQPAPPPPQIQQPQTIQIGNTVFQLTTNPQQPQQSTGLFTSTAAGAINPQHQTIINQVSVSTASPFFLNNSTTPLMSTGTTNNNISSSQNTTTTNTTSPNTKPKTKAKSLNLHDLLKETGILTEYSPPNSPPPTPTPLAPVVTPTVPPPPTQTEVTPSTTMQLDQQQQRPQQSRIILVPDGTGNQMIPLMINADITTVQKPQNQIKIQSGNYLYASAPLVPGSVFPSAFVDNNNIQNNQQPLKTSKTKSAAAKALQNSGGDISGGFGSSQPSPDSTTPSIDGNSSTIATNSPLSSLIDDANTTGIGTALSSNLSSNSSVPITPSTITITTTTTSISSSTTTTTSNTGIVVDSSSIVPPTSHQTVSTKDTSTTNVISGPTPTTSGQQLTTFTTVVPGTIIFTNDANIPVATIDRPQIQEFLTKIDGQIKCLATIQHPTAYQKELILELLNLQKNFKMVQTQPIIPNHIHQMKISVGAQQLLQLSLQPTTPATPQANNNKMEPLSSSSSSSTLVTATKTSAVTTTSPLSTTTTASPVQIVLQSATTPKITLPPTTNTTNSTVTTSVPMVKFVVQAPAPGPPQPQSQQQQPAVANTAGTTVTIPVTSSSNDKDKNNSISSTSSIQLSTTTTTTTAGTTIPTASIVVPTKQDKIFKPHVLKAITSQLHADQNAALHPDCRTPFRSRDDACKRLLRFHVFDTDNFSQADMDLYDKLYGKVADQLLYKKDLLYRKFSYLLFKQQMRDIPSHESVMISRIIYEEEKEALKADKELVASGGELPPLPESWLQQQQQQAEQQEAELAQNELNINMQADMQDEQEINDQIGTISGSMLNETTDQTDDDLFNSLFSCTTMNGNDLKRKSFEDGSDGLMDVVDNVVGHVSNQQTTTTGSSQNTLTINDLCDMFDEEAQAVGSLSVNHLDSQSDNVVDELIKHLDSPSNNSTESFFGNTATASNDHSVPSSMNHHPLQANNNNCFTDSTTSNNANNNNNNDNQNNHVNLDDDDLEALFTNHQWSSDNNSANVADSLDFLTASTPPPPPSTTNHLHQQSSIHHNSWNTSSNHTHHNTWSTRYSSVVNETEAAVAVQSIIDDDPQASSMVVDHFDTSSGLADHMAHHLDQTFNGAAVVDDDINLDAITGSGNQTGNDLQMQFAIKSIMDEGTTSGGYSQTNNTNQQQSQTSYHPHPNHISNNNNDNHAQNPMMNLNNNQQNNSYQEQQSSMTSFMETNNNSTNHLEQQPYLNQMNHFQQQQIIPNNNNYYQDSSTVTMSNDPMLDEAVKSIL